MSEDRYIVDGYLKINDETYSMYGVEMQLVDNSIPTISAMVNPPDSSFDLVTVRKYMEHNTRLQSFKGKKDTKIEFLLRIDDIDTRGQKSGKSEIRLNKWVMIDSGVTSLSAEGSVGMKVVLQHPAYRLSRIPLTMGTEYSAAKNTKAEGKNVYEAVQSGMKRYLDTHDPNKSGSKSNRSPSAALSQELIGIDKERIAELRKLLEELPDLVEWDVEYDFPFQDVVFFSEYLKVFLNHPGRYGPYSIFEGLLQQLVPLGLGISGTLSDEPLKIVARNPWGSPNITINYDEVNRFDLPPLEDPAEGLILKGKMKVGGLFGFLPSDSRNAKTGVDSTRSACLAGYTKFIDKLDGEIIYSTAPPWIIDYQLWSSGNPAPDNRNLDFTGKNKTARKAPTEEHRKRYTDILNRYCADTFFDRLYKNTRSRIITRPYLTGPDSGPKSIFGGLIQVPFPYDYLKTGVVLELKDEDGVINRMYVTHLVHSFDVRSNNATTTISASHCTGPEGVVTPDDEVVVKERELSVYTKPD